MKKVFKLLLWIVIPLIFIVIGFLSYLKLALPNIGEAPDLKIDYTAERIERGQYLANSLMLCIDCHSTRDWSLFSGPPKAGTFGMGGDYFGREFGFPGAFYAKNITPSGISNWTDGVLYRVITSGVNKKGEAIFPIMPYHHYGRMEKEDIYSVIAYIRTLKPIENLTPETVFDFPFNFIVNTIPQEPKHDLVADKSDLVKYGEYLVNAAGCYDCHTQQTNGKFLEDMDFAGGFEFPMPKGGICRSANITPDMETGIGVWTEEMFVQKFKQYADSAYVIPQVAQGEFNSAMPWMMYANIEKEDLKAMFAYLKTVKPVKNEVLKFSQMVQ